MSDETNKKPETGIEEQDVALGRVIRGAVADGLERQRGRALAAFMEAQKNVTPVEHGTHSFNRWKIMAGAASGLAAGLAIVVTLQMMLPPKTTVTTDGAVAKDGVTVLDQVTLTRDVDGGTKVLADDTPVREVRHQELRKTEWFDPAEKATYSVTEPVERVGYVRLQPY